MLWNYSAWQLFCPFPGSMVNVISMYSISYKINSNESDDGPNVSDILNLPTMFLWYRNPQYFRFRYRETHTNQFARLKLPRKLRHSKIKYYVNKGRLLRIFQRPYVTSVLPFVVFPLSDVAGVF